MITQSELKELIHYSPDLGIFTWLVDRGQVVKAGDIAGGPITFPHNNKSYHHIRVNKVLCRAHRLAWIYMTGSIPDDKQIDHINGNSLDNKWPNLRIVSGAENCKNKRLYKTNKSGVSGVYKRGAKWVAEIARTHIGTYLSFGEAVAARREKEVEHGYHVNHGEYRGD